VNTRHVKTPAVVLSSTQFGEGHKLVKLYSEELGRLEATAFGARKTKSRFGSKLEPFTSGIFLLYHKSENSPFSIQDVDVTGQHGALRNDLNRFLIGNAVVEPVLRFVERMHRDQELFEILVEALGILETIDIERALYLLSMYDLNFLSAMGYRPDLKTCIKCVRNLEGEDVYTDNVSGFPVCVSCRSSSSRAVPAGARRFVEWAVRSPLQLSIKVSMKNETLAGVRRTIENLFLCNLGRIPDSWKQMNNLLDYSSIVREGIDE
jgi:DNA repair protein RecO (recombination protein O)